jgi:hypothetical protein
MFEAMRQLVVLFAPFCAERATLDELSKIISDRKLWPTAHELFHRIRSKTLLTEGQNAILEAQYSFEEICAKALYNCSLYTGSNDGAPFKPDAAYLIVPRAFAFSRALGIEDGAVLRIVAGER